MIFKEIALLKEAKKIMEQPPKWIVKSNHRAEAMTARERKAAAYIPQQ